MAEKISRHTPIVRLTHWSVALSGLLLVFSGFGELPMYHRYNIVKLPGLAWASDMELQLIIHYAAAIVFSAAIFFHMLFHLRRKEMAAMPKRGDVKESALIIKAMVTGSEEPPQGKFLAEQRLAYAAIGVTSLILIVTGLLKVAKNFEGIILNPTLFKYTTLLHTAAGMAFFAMFFAHMAAFVIKENRPLFWTMFSGKVDAEYARHRHSLWGATKER